MECMPMSENYPQSKYVIYCKIKQLRHLIFDVCYRPNSKYISKTILDAFRLDE